MSIKPRFWCMTAMIMLLAAGGCASQTPGRGGTPTKSTSPYLAVQVSTQQPALESLAVDSLGQGKNTPNVLTPGAAPAHAWQASEHVGRMEYRPAGAPANTPPAWTIQTTERELRLVTRYQAATADPLTLQFDTRKSHVTLLGLLNKPNGVSLPAVLHLPGCGTLGVTARGLKAASLGYDADHGWVKVTFPPATAQAPQIEYRLAVTTIYPDLPGLAHDPRYDAFRRNWLNILQLNPRRRLLSNNTGSDSCGFCYYEYADVALATPPLADGLSALDLMRQSLDEVLAGVKTYGMPGYSMGNFPEYSADTYPSFLIAATDYVNGRHDRAWLKANYAGVKNWAERMLATDHNGNGLIKYVMSGNSGSWPEGDPKNRPSNWWDTIGFGHEDAYANALAYRGLCGLADLARQINQSADAVRYQAAADKLKAAYFPTFYNPATGVLAGWRSADGQLHDYYFLFVNGIAIHYGLVPADKANAIMDRLLAKIKAVGYTRFDMGLPGNLVSVARKDYAHKEPRFGGGHREDNADGFQIYENGGATACFAYFTLAALYDLGRIPEADAMLFPMLHGFASGGFEGRGPDGKSNDWRRWDGTPDGYEGFLVDNYYALLALVTRQQALAAQHGGR